MPVKEPVNVVAATDVRPDMDPPVIFTLLAFWVDMVPKPDTSVFAMERSVLTSLAERISGAPLPAVFLPIIDAVAISAILPSVTVLSAIVFKLVEPAQVERAVFSTKERPTWDFVSPVKAAPEPFGAR